MTAAEPKWDWQDDGTGPMHIRPINDLITHPPQPSTDGRPAMRPEGDA